MKRNVLAFRTQLLGACFQSLHHQPLRSEKSPGMHGLKTQPGQLRLESFFSNPACLREGTSDGPQEGRQQERAGRQQQLLDPVSMCEDMRSYPPPAVRREKLRVFPSRFLHPLYLELLLRGGFA